MSLIFPVGLGLVLLLASAALIYRLGALPPGFLNAEAANGLLARDASGHGGAVLAHPGPHSALLAGLIALVGRPFGFDMFSARLGAVLAGLGTVLFTSLWLRRVFGSIWGVAGGLTLAGSFWFFLFGRLALSPMAGALTLALMLWCVTEALVRDYRTDALFWYAGAGLAAGLGFISDPTMRIAPVLLLVALIVSMTEHGIALRHTEIVGWLLAILVGLVIAGPFVRQAIDAPNLLAFWMPTPGLEGSTVATWHEAVRNYGVAFARIGWPFRASLGLNLPGTALLSGFILPWAVAGLAVVFRGLRSRLVATALVWGLILLIPAAAITPVHPGRLVPILPLVIALPISGMRALIRLAPAPRYRAMATGLIILMLAGNLAWSDWRYFNDWADSPETAAAFSAGVSTSLTSIGLLPGSDPVLFSTSGNKDVRTYLQPDQRADMHQRFDFNGGEMLPIPLNSPAYLIAPDVTPVAGPLLQILGQDSLPDLDGAYYRVYRLDERAREQLPLSIPTDTFTDGTRFLGHQLTASTTSQISVVLAWQLPQDGKAHTVRLRLRPVQGPGQTQIIDVSLPRDLLDQPYDLLRLATFTAPAPGTVADLSVALLDADGNVLAGQGLDTDGYLFLNRYTFSK